MKLNLLQAHALAIAVLTATGCTPDATPSAPSPLKTSGPTDLTELHGTSARHYDTPTGPNPTITHSYGGNTFLFRTQNRGNVVPGRTW